jgi:hypothetical protein
VERERGYERDEVVITIEADSFSVIVKQGNKASERRAAENGCPPYDSPVRIRIGEDNGENCMVTLRWNDTVEMVTAEVSRAYAQGVLPTVSVAEEDSTDGVTVRIHIAESASVRVTRLTRKG